ncbi:MAG TPA: protein-disulfide reductase DsbD N-terminal domain-containing protein [Solimonas sp.]|nr:protein-disulfide reductase DsbD N-terminal domain-containing protein [Solimonas sp.]
MPLIRLFLLLLAVCGSTVAVARASLSASPALDADGLLPVEEAFRLLPATRQAQNLRIEWTISPGYYLYRGQLRFEVLTPQGFRLAPPQLPTGLKVQDPEFGAVEVYRGIVAAQFQLPPGLKAPLKLRVRYQGCADIGICYPPQTQLLDVPAARS